MAYSYSVNKNKINNSSERKIMTTNLSSKCKMLLCLALPLTVAAGYASDSNRPLNTVSFIDAPVPIVAPVSARQAADIAINKEVFDMFMADTSINYNMSATVHNGVVTIVG